MNARLNMPIKDSRRRSFERFVEENGEWTAMSIQLEEGLHTRPPSPDYRLLRLVQTAQDLLGKPLDQIRVLDLGCLEGQYAIEFAMHGAESVGVELREANLAKAEFAANQLQLERVELRLEDVRDLRREVHGEFDLVICSGILYHLEPADAVELLQRIHEVCTRMVIIDTQIALRGRESVEVDGKSYEGLWYTEHDDEADAETKLRDLWASVDNSRSFWFTHASLCNILADVGFSSTFESLGPHHPVGDDRRMYVALKGQRARVHTSPTTDNAPLHPRPEHNPLMNNPVQRERGRLFRAAKRWLPPVVKNRVKPLLRTLGVLPPDLTPAFLKG